MFSDEKLSQAGQKASNYWYKIFSEAHAYRMLLIFKTLVTYKRTF